MKLDRTLFDKIARKAAESPRLRMNFDLRNSEDEQSQRMLNVLLPGTRTPIHRHMETSETLVCLEGSCVERFFDENGNETGVMVLGAGSDLKGIQIPAGQFHSLEVPSDWKGRAVIIEFKAGKFAPARQEDVIAMK